ncbi:MAG: hypothetical protein ACTSWN_01475 [Promethearchaeota archaeon]
MNLKLKAPENAYIGHEFESEVNITLNEALKLDYAGLELYLTRPCGKPLPVERKEIFCRGTFERGAYSRKVKMRLSDKIVPTSVKRGIIYKLNLFARFSENGNESSPTIQELNEERIVTLIAEVKKKPVFEVNPIILAIKGLKINLQKDIYKPGETMKIQYDVKPGHLKELKVVAMQQANINCKCAQFGKVCKKVPKIPPAAASMTRTSNPSTGFLLLKIPENAELSAEYRWDPKEKFSWTDVFSDYNSWYLKIIATERNGHVMEFEIPFDVQKGTITTEKAKKTIEFFEKESEIPLNNKENRILVKEKGLNINSVEKTNGVFKIKLVNVSEKEYHGCTCKVTGVKDEFFETQPFMVGLNSIQPKSERIMEIPVKYFENVSEFIFNIETNEGWHGFLKRNLS